MAARMKWNGDKAIDLVQKEAGDRVNKAARGLQNYIRINLAKRLAPPHSKPGEYPHQITANLTNKIDSEFDASNLTARVGTTVSYGRWLELGTVKMARRPWLSKGLAEFTPQMKKILRG